MNVLTSAIIFLFVYSANAQPHLILPSFSTWKSDYNEPTKGTEINPLTIGSCLYAPVDWQLDLCSGQGYSIYEFSNHYDYTNGDINYWVVGMNKEPAFKNPKLNGPPNQSSPIDGYTNSIIAYSNGFQLRIAYYLQPVEEIPFLSMGYQKGRGVQNPKLLAQTKFIEFDANLKSDSNLPGTHNSVHFWIETETAEGERLFSWLFLYERGTGSNSLLKWNWPIQESMWYPGAQIKFWTVDQIKNECGLLYTPLVLNKRTHYKIDVKKLALCSFGIENAKLTGFHFAIEQSNYNANVTEASFENLYLQIK